MDEELNNEEVTAEAEAMARQTTVHGSHTMLEHPRKGIYCKDCKGYTYGEHPEKLAEECPGPVDFLGVK